MKPIVSIAFCLVIMCLALSVPGCLGSPPAENTTNDTITPPPAPPVKTPTISIANPNNGEVLTVSGDTADVTLLLSTQNLIVKSPGGAAKKGEGHFRVIVDGGTPVTVTTKTYQIPGLSIGQHTIRVELLNNDRTQYSPQIYREVTFTIEREKPAEYEAQDYVVEINDFSYQPADITVKVKDSVTFVNKGVFPRSATCFLDGKEAFDTKILAPGANTTITFNTVLECQYYATTHRAMTGHIKVVSNGVD